MQIRFVDADGTEGFVDADLTLRYAGRLHQEIAAFIEETLARSGGSFASAPELQGFAIELYATFPLSELEFGSADAERGPRFDHDRSRNGIRPRRPAERIRPRRPRSGRHP